MCNGTTTKVVDLLDPSVFSLLITNAGRDDATASKQLTTSLGPWSDVIQNHPIEPPAGDDGKHFTAAFGSRPSFLLVRPDGYAGYIGPASDLPPLMSYLNHWLSSAGGKHA